MKTISAIIASIFGIFIVGYIFYNPINDVYVSVIGEDNTSAVFFADNVEVTDLRSRFSKAGKNKQKINILIAPGHEPNYGGAEYKNLKEREMALAIAKKLKEYLSNDSHYAVTLTRDENGWNKELADYFATKMDEVNKWRTSQKMAMEKLVADGKLQKMAESYHNDAPSAVALRLYAINKWAGEKKFDIAIHIHINDDPVRRANSAGKFSGFSIYVPEKQYSNADAAQTLANFVFRRLSLYGTVSNLPQESNGVVENQDLIAVGNYNTADSANMLIEYGYIYEPQFEKKETRDAALSEYAYQTALGIQNFFGSTASSSALYDTTLLPMTWEKNLEEGSQSKDVLSLQMALMREGLYPIEDKSRNDCPITGRFGPCTGKALKSFQDAHDIKGGNGILGPKTREVLNSLY